MMDDISAIAGISPRNTPTMFQIKLATSSAANRMEAHNAKNEALLRLIPPWFMHIVRHDRWRPKINDMRREGKGKHAKFTRYSSWYCTCCVLCAE